MAEKIAFFDIDHTIVKKSTGEYFIAEARKRGIVPYSLILSIPFYYFRYRFHLPEWHTFSGVIRGISGIPLEVFRETAERAFIRRIRKAIFPEMEMRIESLRRGGTRIYFATSSVDLFVKPLTDYLKADGLIASSLEFSDGKSTGRFSEYPVFGAEKLRKVEEAAEKLKVPLSECSFYSDSFHDLPLLEAVGEAVAVNPDHRLGKIALRQGWKIIKCRLGIT